jgi:hypothetical protein
MDSEKNKEAEGEERKRKEWKKVDFKQLPPSHIRNQTLTNGWVK